MYAYVYTYVYVYVYAYAYVYAYVYVYVVYQSVAAFLITRPPVGFLGYGWEGKNSSWHAILLLQPGQPTVPCTEPVAGVFERKNWSNGKAVLDCNTWKAELPFPGSGQQQPGPAKARRLTRRRGRARRPLQSAVLLAVLVQTTIYCIPSQRCIHCLNLLNYNQFVSVPL